MSTLCTRCSLNQRRRSHSWCLKCFAVYARATRVPHRNLSPLEKQKVNCRSATARMVKRGTLIKLPCHDCGSPKSQAHHRDYTRPADVEWVCRPCHLAHHGRRPNVWDSDDG